jgi:sporulation protein YtfJ
MVDANTIIGSPITTADGITLIPISKVSFGFASGGSDIPSKEQQPSPKNTFGGGSGAGVHITPVAFLIVQGSSIRLLNVQPPASTTVDRIIELVPEVIDKVNDMFKKEEKED